MMVELSLFHIGPVIRISPNEVSLTDITAVKQVYSTKEIFVKAPWYHKSMPKGAENIFSTADLEFHRRHRRLLSSPLSESSLKTMEPIVRDLVYLSIEQMKREMLKRGAVDVYKWALFTTTDVIGELTFGDSFRMLQQGKVRYSKRPFLMI